jgi:hypothetical protein
MLGRTLPALLVLAITATTHAQVRNPDLPAIPDKSATPLPKPDPARRSPMMVDDMGGDLHAEEQRIKDREQLIEIELKHLDRAALKDSDWAKEWAGDYYEGDGLGENVSVTLAPKAGIAFLNYGCLGLYGGDHGEIVEAFPDGLRLKLAFGDARNSFLSERIYFVKWDTQRFLVPDWLMTRFINNYNQGGYARASMYGIPRLTKDGQPRRMFGADAPQGRPELPPKFAKLLHTKPATLKVTKVSDPASQNVTGQVNARACTIEFQGGADQGVYVGQEFRFPKEIRAAAGFIRITAVTATTSTGEFTAFYSAGQKVEVPTVGVTISTSDETPDNHPPTEPEEPAPKK